MNLPHVIRAKTCQRFPINILREINWPCKILSRSCFDAPDFQLTINNWPQMFLGVCSGSGTIPNNEVKYITCLVKFHPVQNLETDSGNKLAFFRCQQ